MESLSLEHLSCPTFKGQRFKIRVNESRLSEDFYKSILKNSKFEESRSQLCKINDVSLQKSDSKQSASNSDKTLP